MERRFCPLHLHPHHLCLFYLHPHPSSSLSSSWHSGLSRHPRPKQVWHPNLESLASRPANPSRRLPLGRQCHPNPSTRHCQIRRHSCHQRVGDDCLRVALPPRLLPPLCAHDWSRVRQRWGMVGGDAGAKWERHSESRTML